MSGAVAETGFYGPKLTHFPTLPTSILKPQAFNPSPVSTKSTPYFQFLPKRRHFVPSQRGRGRGGILFGEGDDMSEAERNGVLEQEEHNPFFAGSSRFLTSIVRNGLQPTINRLSKWLVAALFTATIIWRHDAESLWAAMGSVLNSVLSVVLKRLLNQERPNSAISSGPGMPSSHAQSILYAAIFLIWSLIEWLGVTVLSSVLSTLVLAGGCYLSWLRVSQQYHTISQVGVGAAVGSAFAIMWLWSWQAFVVHSYASSLWVRLLVIVGSTTLSLCFLVHVIRDWLKTEQGYNC